LYYPEAAFFKNAPALLMRLSLCLFFASACLLPLLSACQMPPLASAPPQDEEGLLLKNVHLYSAKDSQLQMVGQLSELRFSAEQRLLKSKNANILWVPEGLTFQAEYLNARLDTQEAWAPAYWKFQTEDNSFGEGTDAYGYKKQEALVAQTQKPLRLWQGENTLRAEEAHCEVTTKNCAFSGAVKTTLNKAD
jgi:hypothetical protein